MKNYQGISQFFQDERGDYSMSRLSFFIALLTAVFVVIWETAHGRITEGLFGLFVGTFAASAVVSKAIDNKTFGNLAPPPIQPGQPAATPPS